MITLRLVNFSPPFSVNLRKCSTQAAFGQFEKQRDQASSRAGPSALSEQPTRSQTGSPISIGDIRTSKVTGTVERNTGHAGVRKVPAPSSTGSFSTIPTSSAGEVYLESEEWLVEDRSNWVVILAGMRSNVQSRSASLLGHTPVISHNPKQSGPKVYLCYHPRCYPRGLIKLYVRASIRQRRAT